MPDYTNFLGLYKPNRNDAIALDTSLADNFATIDSKLGSALKDSEGNVFSNLGERFDSLDITSVKINEIVRASDYNLVGDGVADDTTELQRMFDDAQGKILLLESGKVYGINGSTTVHVRSNTTVFSNGAEFRKITNGTVYALELSGSNISFNKIRLIPSGTFNETGVKITGALCHVGIIDTSTETLNTGGNSVSLNSLLVDGAVLLKIGAVITKNWERPIQIANSQQVTVDYFDVQVFSLAVYIKDCKHLKLLGAHIRDKSSLADGDAGENGILLEAKTHNATEDIYVANWLVERTGEHGYRVGGGYEITRVTFDNCTARETGQGRNGNGTTEAGVGHGGCGFKVLGPTINSGYHREVTFNNCKSLNGRDDILDGGLNFAGFYIGKCINVTINNPIVDTDGVSTSATSWVNGIEIIGSEEVTINNPSIHHVNNHSVHIQDYQQDGYDWGTLISRIVINGGILSSPARSNYNVEARYYTFRRLTLNNVLLEGGTSVLRGFKSGTGDFLTCFASGYVSTGFSNMTLDGMDDWIVDMKGVFTSSPNNCANGSTFNSTAGFKIRKAGAWVDY